MIFRRHLWPGLLLCGALAAMPSLSLALEPLPEGIHRLKPGDSLQFTVDADKRLRKAPKEVTGIAIGRPTGYTNPSFPYERDPEGKYVLPPETEALAKDLRLPMTRFYYLSNMAFGLNGAIDRCAALCDKFGIPQESTPMELDGGKKLLPPEDWAAAVKYSISKGYKFRMWEVSNEPWDYLKPERYAEHVLAVSKAVKAVQPDAQIGIALKRANDLEFGHPALLGTLAGSYDWVASHYYDFSDAYTTSFEDVVLMGNCHSLSAILHNAALIKASDPSGKVFQYDTEWSLHSLAPKGRQTDDLLRNANIYGSVHRAVRLIYYVREDLVRGAAAWSLFSYVNRPGFAHLTMEPGRVGMPYWVHYYFNRHLGEWVLDMEGTAPYYTGSPGEPYKRFKETFSMPLTPLVATLSKDAKTLFLIAANGSWDKTVPLRMDIANFAPSSAAGVLLSNGNPDAHPFLERKEDFVGTLPVELKGNSLLCSLPPHSVSFVTVSAK